MRPRVTAATIAVVCTIWILSAVGAQANTVHGPTKETFITVAQRIHETYYDRLNSEENAYVDGQIARLSADGPLMNARDISSAAVMIAATASSAYIPVILASAAAQTAPDDPLLVNNFAAMLRSSGLLDESIEVLLYADSLAPNSPVILTNLGNSYLDKGMLSEAETSYRKALACDPDFDAAHYGMSIIWVQRGNGDLAMYELGKAARGGFVPSMRQVFLGASRQGGSVSRPFWDVIIEEDPDDPRSDDDPRGQSDDAHEPQGDRLILPTLPKWESRMAFLASAPTFQRLAKQIMDKGLVGAFTFAARYHPEATADAMSDDGDWDDGDWDDGDWDDGDWDDGDWDDGESYSDPAGSFPQIISTKPQYGQQLFMLELVNDYYAHMIEQELTSASARRRQIDERYEREMTNLREGGQFKQLEQMIIANQIPEAKELAKTINKLGGQIADSHFYAWRDLTLDSYGHLKSLLLEYWRMSDQVTASIYDQDVVDYVNAVREITVYASFLPLALDLATLPVSYALAEHIAPIVTKDEDISALKTQPVGELVVPEKKAKKCELKDKIAFGIGIASFAVDCSSWELEVLAGVGGAYKQNFKTGESEISVLVGAKAGAGVGPVKGELSAKGGVTLRFDSDGNFVGWSDRGEIGMKTGVGPLSGGQSLEGSANLGSIAGPRTQTTSSCGVDG
jgi:tetratricopeptide (TPR) repeat protein